MPAGCYAPIAQSAEAVDLKSIQCGFESHWGHRCFNEIAGCGAFSLTGTVQRSLWKLSAIVVTAFRCSAGTSKFGALHLLTMSKPRFFEGRRLDRPNEDVEDQGLAFDMGTVLSRRRLLGVLGVGAGATALAACGASGTQKTGAGANGTASTESTTSANSNSLTEMNTETAGPYPGDGSNSPDVLDETGIERRDLKNSVDGNGSVEGVPMTLTMRLVDISNDNQPLVGAAVYVWHCNAEGEYSMYSNGVTDQTWLRGVQVTDDDGAVTFDSIVPGCYDGRWPHIHFEVFPDLDAITDATNAVLTSQLVIPEEVGNKVYADARYAGSAENLARVSLDTDMVFSDGWDQQTPSVIGSAESGYTFTIKVPVDPTTKSSPAEDGAPKPPDGQGRQGGPAQPPPEGSGPSAPPNMS